MKKQPPQIFYKAKDLDELKAVLNLLPDMVGHPEFPFGQEDTFTMLGVHVRHVYQATYPE